MLPHGDQLAFVVSSRKKQAVVPLEWLADGVGGRCVTFVTEIHSVGWLRDQVFTDTTDPLGGRTMTH